MDTNRNPIGWFEIYVQDMDRARAFYEKTFQVSLARLPGTDLDMWGLPMHPDGSGCSGALVQMDGKDSGGGGTIVYFSCADCAVEAARSLEHGGQVEREKYSIGSYGFIAYVVDTEGNRIGLHSM